MKKITVISLLTTSLFMLTACSTNNQTTSSNTKESTAVSQKSDEKTNNVNLNGKDAFEYYNVSYEKPQQIADIAGIYQASDMDKGAWSENSLIVFDDGRYIVAEAGLLSSPETNYFDSNNSLQKKTYNATTYPYQLSVTDAGRIVEKDDVYYLFSPLDGEGSFITNLDTDGNQVVNQFISDSSKDDIEVGMKDIEDTNAGFIKDGTYFESKNTATEDGLNKVDSAPKTEGAIENVTYKVYDNTSDSENGSQYVEDLLESNNLNDLFYLTGVGRNLGITDSMVEEGSAPEIEALSSDELESVKDTDQPLQYGFKVTERTDGELSEFPDEVYATDGETVYILNYNQLEITAQELGTAQSPEAFID
jgi:hypothetical protein